MGVYGSKPDKRKSSYSGHVSNINFDVSSMQGWRRSMEDRFAIELNIIPSVHFFAIFDGLGGPELAEFCKEVLPRELKLNEDFKNHNWEKAFEDTFNKLDNMLRRPEGRELMDKIHGGPSNPRLSGTSAEVCLITPNEIILAEVGNSKVVLVTKDKKCQLLSVDHTVQDKKERDRIRAAGGWISEGRVNDSLIITRSIGLLDYKMNDKLDWKNQIITSQPTIKKVLIQDDFEFLILATDGTFDLITETQVADEIRAALVKGRELKGIIDDLLDRMIAKDTASGDGCDNMTLMVLVFVDQAYQRPEIKIEELAPISPSDKTPDTIEKKTTDFYGPINDDL